MMSVAPQSTESSCFKPSSNQFIPLKTEENTVKSESQALPAKPCTLPSSPMDVDTPTFPVQLNRAKTLADPPMMNAQANYPMTDTVTSVPAMSSTPAKSVTIQPVPTPADTTPPRSGPAMPRANVPTGKPGAQSSVVYSRKGPIRKKCVWCSLTRGHFCEQASRCSVREKLGGIGSDELLEKCRQLKPIFGERVKLALISEGASGVDHLETLQAQGKGESPAKSSRSQPSTPTATTTPVMTSVAPQVASDPRSRALSIEAARRTQESPFESLLIAASISEAEFGMDRDAVTQLESLRILSTRLSEDTDDQDLSPAKADVHNPQQQQFVTPRRLQWPGTPAGAHNLVAQTREHVQSAPPFLDSDANRGSGPVPMMPTTPNGSRKRKGSPTSFTGYDGYDYELAEMPLPTSVDMVAAAAAVVTQKRSQSVQGRPYAQSIDSIDGGAATSSDVRPSKKSKASARAEPARRKTKRDARRASAEAASASSGRRLNNTKLKGSGVHPMKIFVMDKRVWLFCACRECKETIIQRDSEATSPYCSAKCQTREQNIRQNRVKCGTHDYTDAKVNVYKQVLSNQWKHTGWTQPRTNQVKQMLAVQIQQTDCLVPVAAQTKKKA